MGKQLCRFLQSEILPTVPHLRLFGLDARTRFNDLARCELHGQELQDFPLDFRYRNHCRGLFLCHSLRAFRGNYVRRSDPVHN